MVRIILGKVPLATRFSGDTHTLVELLIQNFFLHSVVVVHFNNNNPFLYSAFHTRRASQSASHYYPWSLGLNSLIKLSQLPGGEYAACATLICATRLNQSQEPSLPSQVPIYPWVERSNYS